jgi:beta-galactosidase/beta-glucuronidase
VNTDNTDTVNTTIGIRSIKYTGDQGFFMNEQHVKVRGFCDHNDFASVGMGVPDRIKLFRAQASRGVGGNGRRMSHNPPGTYL